jgi:hypothetical protein
MTNDFLINAREVCREATMNGDYVQIQFKVGKPQATITFTRVQLREYEKHQVVARVEQVFRRPQRIGSSAINCGMCCNVYDGETPGNMLEKINDMIEYNKAEGLA